MVVISNSDIILAATKILLRSHLPSVTFTVNLFRDPVVQQTNMQIFASHEGKNTCITFVAFDDFNEGSQTLLERWVFPEYVLAQLLLIYG